MVGLNSAIEGVLPVLQAEALARMVDTVRFTRPGVGEAAWDDELGKFVAPTPTVVYEGRCRVRQANPAPQSASSGEAQWAVDRVVVSLPLSAGAVVDGCVGVVSASRNPALVGARLTVQSAHLQTDSTAYRVPCLVVSRDAGSG